MNLEDQRRLKFDRRLRNRRGWVTSEEVAAEEASLPDAAGKAAKDDEVEEPRPAEAPTPESPGGF